MLSQESLFACWNDQCELSSERFSGLQGHQGVDIKVAKLYLDMQHVGRIPDAFRLTATEINQHCGMNLGNFVFRHALRNVLADLDEYTPVTGAEYKAILEHEKAESVIISCANWLGQTARDEAWNLGRSKMVEMADCSVVAFGLGVQASGLRHDGAVPLGPDTVRLCKVLSERSANISVRDELTRRTLEANGIDNVVTTGCPSNFLNCDPKLGDKLYARGKANTLAEWTDVRTAISEVTGGHALSGAIYKSQLSMMEQTPAFYVVQTPDFVDFLMGDRGKISAFYRENNPFVGEPNKLTRLLKSKGLFFTDVDSWMIFCRTCDFSTGMRIHGTMVPLQSGVPAILIAHDSRTVGLADAMGVPWMSPDDYLDLMPRGPKGVFEAFSEKIQGFDEKRAVLAQIMVDFLNSNRLTPNASLLALT